ncbi:PAS domain S-box protein [Rhodoferax sediminis]|nr:PAS domain S-box protein [Rhodoferax sediminis]
MQAPNKTSGNGKPVAISAQALRERAEEIARKKTPLASRNPEKLSPGDMRQTLHELQVHQIELEMQNEELRQAQLQLDTAKARYFDLYDLAPVGYCTVSEPGLILEANFAAATLLGMGRGELVGQRFSRFIFKADQDIYYLCRKQLTTGEAQRCELRMVNDGGSPCWVQLAASAAQDADGAHVTRVVLSDVSNRKLMEAAIQESEEQYRTLFELVPVAVYSIDTQGVIHKFNRKAAELWGRRPAPTDTDARFCGSLKLFHPDGTFMPHDQCPMAEVVSGKISEVHDTEVLIERSGGSRVTVVVNIRPLKNQHGEVTGAVNCFYDITERKQLELELKIAMAAAEKANRAKSDFLSGMSHELRTPLNAILGFAQLIESGTPAPTAPQKRSVDQILHAGWYLLELVNGILDLALVESGKLSLSRETTSLAGLMQECATMIEPQANQRGITLTFPSPELPYFVNADRTRMKQILVNLLSNAIKYNRVGGTVNVTCTQVSPERIRICVEDAGEGLSQENIRHLFEPFNRLGRDALAEEGTGIGLVMAKRLVEMMGGIIGVESTVGKGSTFWIEMDLTTRRQASQATDAPQALVQPQANAPLRTLLYVEDNPANLMLVESLVERRPDMRLLSARDGNRGVEIARAALPDIILMDINLPDISGVEVLKLLRKDLATAHIPVLALSADALPRDIDKGLEAGFFRYLTKPIRIDAFMATMDEALEFAKTQSVRAAKDRQLQ